MVKLLLWELLIKQLQHNILVFLRLLQHCIIKKILLACSIQSNILHLALIQITIALIYEYDVSVDGGNGDICLVI